MNKTAVRDYTRWVGVASVAVLSLVTSAPAQQAQANAPVNTQHYLQTNLVSNLPGKAPVHDPNLVNPWGLTRGTGSPWWISDNGTGLSTLYDGAGHIVPLVVTIPPADASSKTGNPTGTVFNGGTGFTLAPKLPAVFLFVTEDGTVSGWNPKVKPTQAVIKANQKNKSVFKGATIGTINLPGTGVTSFLYVADFRQGRVEVFDTSFKRVPALERFTDSQLPAGYAPFNVQNIGNNIYVAFALQDSNKQDEVAGRGLGYVDVFSTRGQLLRRLEHGQWFNAPWGLAQAPGDFGSHSHDILVGQFGSGQILTFDAVTGHFKGELLNAKNQSITIPGLWALSVGSGAPTSGSAIAVYFTAGINHEQDGLFGNITAVENPQGSDQ
jgi:uncharacterized protein (TIGR03118 family)